MIQGIEQAINEQIAKEAEASFSYLSMAVWCDYKGLEAVSYTHLDVYKRQI